MDSRGMTLVELLVTVAIITIVIVVAGFQFVGWQAKYKVESQIKELHATFMDARMRARQKNIPYYVKLDKETSDDTRREWIVYEGSIGPAQEVGDLTKKGLPYRLDWDDSGGRNAVGNKIVFVINTKGFVSMEKLSGEGLMFPDPFPPTVETEGMPDFMKLWVVDWEDKRYIAADIPDPSDRPDVSYDCIAVMETRVNIGKLNDGGDRCDEK